jgi:aryl-alcohol dehydrogenase-like predicted oxidoreductase
MRCSGVLNGQGNAVHRCIQFHTKSAGADRAEVFDTFQIPYSCLAPQHRDLITHAAESGAGIILRGGVAQGGPDAEIERPALNDVWSRAKLDEVLPANMCRAELILRYTLTHPHCHTTIVGTCNPEHLAENLAAAAWGRCLRNCTRRLLRESRRRLQGSLVEPTQSG